MVVLTLTKLWINLLATGDSLSATTNERGLQVESAGEVRTYAGGRRRFIAREGVSVTFTVTLRNLTLTQVQTLQGWVGQAVQIRDHRGQLFNAVYTGVRVSEYKSLRYDATIEAHTITVADGV